MKFVVLGDIGRRHLYHVGDEAMTDVAIDMLSARGASQVTLVATDPSEAHRLYDLPAVARVGFGPRWSRADLDARLREIAENPAHAADLDAAVKSADAVLIAGGGNMTSHFAHHIYERLVLTRIARRHSKPLLLTSQTVGPLLRPRDEELVAEILGSAVVFGARDDATYALLRRLRPDANVWRTCDDAILLQTAEEDRLDAERLRPNGSRYIVGSFTSDPGASGLDRHTYLDRITRSLDTLASDHDADVLLIPHAGSLDGPVAKLDELSDQAIVDRSTSDRIRALPTMTARQTVAVMTGALLSLSTRYHPVVFAPVQGVPTLGISLSLYSSARMAGALRPVGMQGAVVPATAWHTVDGAAQELLEASSAVSPWLREHSRSRAAEQEAWWDELVSAASSGTAARREPRDHGPPFSFQGDWVEPAATALAVLGDLDRERTAATWLSDDVKALTAENTRLRRDLAASKQAATRLQARVQRERSRKVVRLADRLGSLFRPVRPEAETAGVVPKPPVLLSVIVPLYNVEPYLEECLASIGNQSLTDLEIILIDDGSTDGSAAIAQRFADADSRVRFIRQENRGLGAVRNRGADLASGTYLTFVDSDDVVPKNALKALVDSLEASGSDLAIGAVNRIRPDGSVFTPGWVRELHSHDRRTTLTEDPAILRNFYTWSKVFHADFWRSHGFRFREGVLFEDQPVVTEALHHAKSIDVLTQTVYQWRIRADDSSLTGKMFSRRDITARHEATQLTAQALDALDSPDHVTSTWRWTLAEYHFPTYLKNTVNSDGDAYQTTLMMVGEFLNVDQLEHLEGVSAANRALLYTALTGSRDQVAALLDEGASSAAFALLDSDDRTTLAIATLPDDAPAWVNTVAEREQQLIAVLTDHAWNTAGTLSIRGKAGIAQLPAASDPSLLLTLESGDVQVSLPATTQPLPASPLPREYGVAQWVEFETTIDFMGLLADHADLLRAGASLHVHLTADTAVRSGPLNRFPSASPLAGSALPAGRETVTMTWTRAGGLSVKIDSRPISGGEVSVKNGVLRLTVRSHAPDLDPTFLTAKAPGQPERRSILRRIGPGSYTGAISVAWLEPGDSARIAVLDDAGQRRNVHVPGDVGTHTSAAVVLRTARGGGLLAVGQAGNGKADHEAKVGRGEDRPSASSAVVTNRSVEVSPGKSPK